jgi:D-amino-acid oxidase
MRRREVLIGSAVAALSGCAKTVKVAVPVMPAAFRVAPIRASVDRIFRTTVCSRPFRAAGPRLDAERVGDKLVLHNYGHGGSGWSLSWGSAEIVTARAMATGERDVAVIGCGALGLTAAITLQRAGARVTIYAKERPPEVRSSRATGSWTPDSRVALEKSVAPDFPALWEKMARSSFRAYQSYYGAPGSPVEWLDRYNLHDEAAGAQFNRGEDPLGFAHYQSRIEDISPRSYDLPPGSHPFPTKYARKGSSLTFNIASLSRQLVQDFFVEGGRMEMREFHSPSELAQVPQKVIVNATGYGARALWRDDSIVPVRGQITWLIPQPEVNYAVIYKGVYVLSRRDGIVVQDGGIGEMEGYNNPSEEPDRAAAEASVKLVAELFSQMKT